MKKSLIILLFCTVFSGAQAQNSAIDRLSLDAVVLPFGAIL